MFQEFSPVSLVIRRTPKVGHEAKFEEALKELVALLEVFPGHIGTGVLRPGSGVREYTVLARFISADAAVAWEHSGERQQWLQLMEPLNDRSSELLQHTGLEFWFTPPEDLSVSPPHWKLIVLSIGALYPVSLVVNVALTPVTASLPLWLRVLIMSCVVVPVMLTWVLPFFTRRFARWLLAE